MSKIAAIVLVTAALLMASCAPTMNPAGTGTATEIGLSMPIAEIKGLARSGTTWAAGYTALVRAFDSSRNILAIGGAGVYSVTLNWDAVNSRWAGSIDLSSVDGNTIFLAVVSNASSEVVYQGSNTISIGESNRNTAINLAAATSFANGDTGPAGGWIYHDKGSYSDSWRYLEAAPSDLANSWSGITLEDGYTVDVDGNVRDGSNVVQMNTTDWYWGANGDYTTVTDSGKGTENTSKLITADATSSATPKVKKGKGRPTPPLEGTGIPRRMLSTTVGDLTQNTLNDWFTPSSAELSSMYTNIRSADRGFDLAKKYWSSSESASVSGDGTKKAWHVDFSSASAAVEAERLELHRVRPSRRF